jgi:hypothetical protein
MNAGLGIVIPDGSVFERGRGRIQKQTDGHPFIVPNPNRICYRVRVYAALLLQMGGDSPFEYLEVPFILEELDPFIIITTLMKMPHLMHKGVEGKTATGHGNTYQILRSCVWKAPVCRGHHRDNYRIDVVIYQDGGEIR